MNSYNGWKITFCVDGLKISKNNNNKAKPTTTANEQKKYTESHINIKYFTKRRDFFANFGANFKLL